MRYGPIGVGTGIWCLVVGAGFSYSPGGGPSPPAGAIVQRDGQYILSRDGQNIVTR